MVNGQVGLCKGTVQAVGINTNWIDAMAIYQATKTLLAIEECIRADQGSSFRGWLGKVIPHIGDAYRQNDDPFRSHMGASQIGNDCPRQIWYGFRWAMAPKFSGRALRLFNRGHLEEARFIAMLLMIGVKVYQQDEKGNQFRVSDAGGHFGGSGDGIAVGVPDLDPETQALCEFKTANDKSFKAMKKSGVKESKFEHYVQMNVYMRKMGIAVALYMVVNKNDDELYAELVPLDAEIADQYVNRGVKLVYADVEPERINNSPGWYQCKWCDFRPVCHLGQKPETNCRTCQYANPMEDGTWKCKNFESDFYGTIDKQRQLLGCNKYRRKF